MSARLLLARAPWLALFALAFTGCDDDGGGDPAADAAITDGGMIDAEPEPACGNGEVETGEACDDGNTTAGDGCSPTCTVEATPPECGNGAVEAGETCDDGNTDPGDGCDADCQEEPPPEPECGNAIVEDGEACDDGNTEPGDGCDADCQAEPPPATCGDGTLDDAEECDDGNTEDGDGCSAMCTQEPACGDGRIDEGEACDDGNVEDGDGCDQDCQLEGEAECGNGVVEADEDCDDGNTTNLDGCSDTCVTEIPCIIDDDCNAGQVCANDFCADAGECGNALIEGNEGCDDGNTDPGDGCDPDCQPEPVCGDGVVAGDEACDDGNMNPGDGCDPDCQLEPICGNGDLEGDEACDDGNLENGDGCNDLCRIETVCGDGDLEGDEQCDDGNMNPGDGCDPNCQFELGECGNGELEPREECDDANLDDGDGCDNFCTLEQADLVRGLESGGGSVPAGQSDLFRFTVDHSQSQLRVQTDGCDAGLFDTVLTVLTNVDGAPGAQVAQNDDGEGIGACSLITADLDAGDYFLRVTGAAEVQNYGFEYRLSVDASAPGAYDGAWAQTGDDRYAITVAEANDYVFETGDGAGGCPAGDTRLTLFSVVDGGPDQVGFNDDGGVGLCSRLEQRLEPGTYALVADGFDGRASPGYVLTVSTAGVCGDGVINVGEACDNGPDAEGDFCDADCQILPGCGNGVVDNGEQCDPGPDVEGDFCDADCQVIAACGNNLVDEGEECDDGNLVPGDGCDAECQTEVVDLVRGIEQPQGGFARERSDLYRFVVDHGPTQLTTSTGDGAGGCPGDTTLTVFVADAEGNPDAPVAQNDDGGPGLGLCSLIDVPLEPGTYFIEVAGQAGRPIETYELAFRLAANVSEGGQFAGATAQDGDDLFTLALDEGATVRLQTSDGEGGCPGDTRIAIFGPDVDGNQVRLFFNDDGGDGLCSRLDVDLLPGDYDVVVDGFAGRPLLAYVLSVELGGECGDGVLSLGEACDDGNLAPGDGCDENCAIEPGCGNGIVEGEETCDNGPDVPDDLCDPDCQLLPGCGNGVLEDGEQCDDGNTAPGDGCADDCSFEQTCGNGEVEGLERCDDGNLDDGDGCDAQCTPEAEDLVRAIERRENGFGEGGADEYRFSVQHAGSDVQFSVSASDGGCLVGARVRYFGFDEAGERMLLGSEIQGEACVPIGVGLPAGDYVISVDGVDGAAFPAYALDYRQETEIGDGGDFDGGFGLRGDDLFVFTTEAGAIATLSTGDGVGGCPGDTRLTLFRLEAAERVQVGFDDDRGFGPCSLVVRDLLPGAYEVVVDGFAGRAIPAYVLSAAFLPRTCGDGELDEGEACDDGNITDGDGCDAFCNIEPECGNGALEEGEECDPGADVEGDFCTPECQLIAGCGNGALDDGEACDDGNQDDGDGCSAACALEAGCNGNGAIDGLEQCDDGNLDDDDGCDALCTFEVIGLVRGLEERRGGFGQGLEDEYRFTVDHTFTDLAAQTSDGAGDCPGDTRLTLFAVDGDGNRGAQVFFNDDGGDGVCSLLARPLEAGTYALVVDGFRGAAIPDYTLDFRLTVPVGPGEFAGAFTRDGNDVYVLDLDADAQAAIETGDGAGGCPGDTRLAIFPIDDQGARGDRIFNDDGGFGLCSRVEQPFTAGRYEIEVDGFLGRPIAAYTLSIRFAGECGDAQIDLGEECDPGPDMDGDLCDANCQLLPGCGNGRVEEGEQCDPGRDVPGDACDAGCQLIVACGNGVIDEGEACDDGNLDNGDGCDAACSAEDLSLRRGIEQQTSRFAQGSRDNFRFTVDDARNTFSAQTGDGAGGCPGDTRLALVPLDAAGAPGERLAFNDDGGFGVCSLIEIDALPVGDYLLVVDGFGGRAIDLYTLDARLEVDINAGGQYDGAFLQDGNDLFVFTLEGNAAINIATGDGVGGCPPGDTFMSLFAVDGDGGRAMSQTNDDGGVGLCSRIEAELVAGTYEIEVRGFNNSAHAGYVLDVDLGGPGVPGPQIGELVITEIMNNPSAVGDAEGEWFEVLNVSDHAIEMNGVVFSESRVPGDTFTVADDLTIEAGAYAVFGRNGDLAANGGVTVDYVYIRDGITFNLNQSSDDIIITNVAGVEIDRVRYDNGATFPDPNGASMQLDGDLDPAEADNADGSNWCAGDQGFGAGDPQDTGTPGAANTACNPVNP